MKNLKRFLIALLVLIVFSSCSCSNDEGGIETQTEIANEKTDVNKPETIIFGQFFGKCIGNNCIDIFKLQGELLLEDKADQYPNSDKFYEGSFLEFRGSEKIDIHSIRASIPVELLNSRSGVLGDPDVADDGGLYLEYSDAGVRKFWIVDLRKQNVPKYLHSYMDTIKHKINEINKVNSQY